MTKGSFEMENVSILEWNIHQQGGTGEGIIPPWVKDEVSGFGVAVLTEFCGICEGRNKVIAGLEERGYHCVASENPKGYRGCRNDILIAVKSSYSIQQCLWVPCYGVNDPDSIPENLRVDIQCGNNILTIIGIRIKDLHGDYQKRRDEFRWLLNWIKDIENPILITGDLNNNRRGSKSKIWSMNVIEEMIEPQGFKLYTPEGSSIYEEGSQYQFPYDHFIAKGVEIDLQPYDRDFTMHDRLAYFLGRDFREPWYPGACDKDLAKVAPPFPDHAILKGTLCFPSNPN